MDSNTGSRSRFIFKQAKCISVFLLFHEIAHADELKNLHTKNKT